ncbi:DsbA family protein [Paenibacillus sp. 7124]|uniref:DsbA family protein n=1 Tax=Paenibacillus apii TaxID=1850370 RepID=A0A6M1PMM6_9BACL|nr:thioredoxin domain-containing protein [Paenibacillus apii]NGM84436.1 DsbA family protein [Paenibacillus apii]NJJ38386.1 DsbA family protein [Paenibacillus apii]
MNKKILLSIVILILCLGITSIITTFIVKNQSSDITDLPTLMDASGKIDLEVGDFNLSYQPYIGDSNAPIKVIEFADFKCPACRNWDRLYFDSFKEEFIDTGKVQFYFINFPFLGPDSIEAAVAAEAMYNQEPGKFWEFKEKLFQKQGEEKTIWATEKFLLDFVKDNISGVDYNLFESNLKNRKYLFDVKKDFKISAANGIYGTPSFIVNGEKVGPDKLENKVNELID